jgi:hypothetical protein
MDILLSSNQQNTQVASEPQFQTWAPIPAITNYYYNTNLGTLPIILPTNYKIKDFRGTPAEVGFTSIRCIITHMAGAFTAVNWLSIFAIPLPGNSVQISPLSNNTTFTTPNTLQNVNLLQPGVYSRKIRFQVQGLTPSVVWQNIEMHEHEIRLTVSNENFVWNPASFNFVHLAGTLPMEEKELTISGSVWTLGLDSRFSVTTEEVSGVTITNVPVINNTLVAGIGAKTIKIALKESFNDATPPAVGNGSWRLSSSETFVADIPFNIALTDIDNVITVEPRDILFSAFKSITEPVAVFVRVITTLEVTVLQSPWLIVFPGENEVNGLLQEGYWVVPIPTQNMDAGTYQGFVDFVVEYDSEEITLRVDVVYNLFGFIASPYNLGNAFTLDTLFYELNAENDLVYYDVEQNIKTFDFFTDNQNTIVIPEKFPLYKRKAKFNIGERLHRILPKFDKPNDNYYQYIPAQVTMTVNENLIQDNTLVRTFTLPVQKFIAGLSDNVTGVVSFLDVNPNMKRVTKKGHEYLNLLMPSIPITLKTYKNGELVSEEELPLSFGKIVSKKVSFEDYNQGDVITYKLFRATDIDSEVEKSFVVLPQGEYSNMIVWENEFLLQSVLEATGSFSSKTEFLTTQMTKFKDLNEVLDYLEVRKKSNFALSSGWVLKTDNITIESLMSSKRVWIKLPSNEWLDLRPVSKSIVNVDSERALIEYDLEFQLNRKNNAKTYSF